MILGSIAHSFLGLTYGEWASMFAVAAAITGVCAALGRYANRWLTNLISTVAEKITEPVVESVNRLTEMTELAQAEQRRTNHRLAEHDEELGKHNREIGELYGATGLARRGREDNRDED